MRRPKAQTPFQNKTQYRGALSAVVLANGGFFFLPGRSNAAAIRRWKTYHFGFCEPSGSFPTPYFSFRPRASPPFAEFQFYRTGPHHLLLNQNIAGTSQPPLCPSDDANPPRPTRLLRKTNETAPEDEKLSQQKSNKDIFCSKTYRKS